MTNIALMLTNIFASGMDAEFALKNNSQTSQNSQNSQNSQASQSPRVVDAWGVPADYAAGANIAALPPGHYTATSAERPTFAILPPPAPSSAPAPAADAAERSPFGVMTHYAQHWAPDSIPVFAAAGIKHVRDEIFWNSTEPERGKYTMPEKFTRYMDSLAAHNMDALIVLSFGNPHYDATPGIPVWAAAPYTDDGFDGYANYAKYILSHWGDRIKHVEIWNEYNGNFARGPANGSPLVYREMLKRAYRAIKEIRPDVKVYSCSTIGIPLDWIETVFEDGGIDHCDGVSVHPYGYTTPPEDLIPRIEALRALIRKHNNGRDKPIWVTEQGWYLTTDAKERKGNRQAITEAAQARYLARSWVVFLGHGIERIFWYVGRNDNVFPTMGLIASDTDPRGKYAPKPAYSAYAALIAQLEGFDFKTRETIADAPDIYIYVFANRATGEECRVIWTPLADAGKCVSLASAAPLLATDMYGRAETLAPVAGRVHLYATDSPIYLRGRVSTQTPPRVENDFMPVRIPAKIARGYTLPLEVDVGEGNTLIAPEPVLAANEFEQFRRFTVVNAKGETIFFGAPRAEVVEPISISRYPQILSANAISISVENATTNPITVRFESELVLDANQQKTFEQKLSRPLAPFAINKIAMTATLADGDKIESAANIAWCPVLPRTPDLARGAAAFDGLPKLSVDDWEYTRLEADCAGADDLGGFFQFCWDADNFYIFAAIADDVHHQPDSGNNAWRGDSLQLGISNAMPWLGGEWMGMTRKEFGIALTPSGPEIYEGGRVTPNAIARIERDETAKRSNYALALPWSALGLNSAADFSMGIYVNDNDGAGRKGFKHWAGMKNIEDFQVFRLQEKSERE